MGEARFFHLMQSSAEAVVRANAQRGYEQGWHMVVRSPERATLERLDTRLWAVPEDSFLPHGMAGGPHDAAQPLLLTEGQDLPNGAVALFALDGAEVSAEEATRLERVWIIFDGHDAAAVERAREQWRSLTGAGVVAEYWSEETGRWAMKTSSRKA